MTNYFAKNITMLLERANLTPHALSERLGIDSATVYRWLDPKFNSVPRARTRITVAEYFGLDVNDLTERELSPNTPINPTPTDHGRPIKRVVGDRVPFLTSPDYLVVANLMDDDVGVVPEDFTPSADKWLPPCPDKAVDTGDLIALRMNGDAMAPEIRNGDLLYIDFDFAYRKATQFKSGDIVLGYHVTEEKEHEAMVRQLLFGETEKEYWLKALNPDWPQDKRLIRASYILGKVVAIFRNLT